MIPAVDALVRLGGIGAARDICAHSSRQRLRSAVARGDIVRVGHNRYALPVPPQGLEAAMACGGHLSHLSAAQHWGWPVWVQPRQSSLIAPMAADLSRVSRWVTLRTEDLPGRDVEGWATAPLRTVLDCAHDLPFVQALAVADSALRRGSIDHDQLVTAAEGRPDHVRLVAAWADDRPANVFESALRALAVRAGLPVVPQYETRCGALTLHPDLANPFAGIAIEAESWGFHADKETHDRDCARFNALIREGWLVLRFTWPQVMYSPDYVVAAIQDVVAQRTAA